MQSGEGVNFNSEFASSINTAPINYAICAAKPSRLRSTARRQQRQQDIGRHDAEQGDADIRRLLAL
jgi:hypothetical protein